MKVDFNLKDLFNFLDVLNKGAIELYDLKSVCKYLNIANKGQQEGWLNLFINRFDFDEDKKLLFSDICKAFLSNEKKYRDLVVERASYYSHIVTSKE